MSDESRKNAIIRKLEAALIAQVDLAWAAAAREERKIDLVESRDVAAREWVAGIAAGAKATADETRRLVDVAIAAIKAI